MSFIAIHEQWEHNKDVIGAVPRSKEIRKVKKKHILVILLGSENDYSGLLDRWGALAQIIHII